MKFLAHVASVSTFLVGLGVVDRVHAQSLSPQEFSRFVTHALDDRCGDAWCEGPFDFLFDDFRCDQEGCQLEFQMVDSDHFEVAAAEKQLEAGIKTRISGYARSYKVSCSLDDMASYQVGHLTISGDGSKRFLLDHSFFGQIDDCIDSLEVQIYWMSTSGS